MFIQIKDGKLVAYGKFPFEGHSKEIEDINYEEYLSSPNKYKFNGSHFEINANYERERKLEEKERIGMLKMTPLDFIKALESVGVSYSTIKKLCDENEEVDKQLRFCNMVYRGNELLDNLCGQFGITSEQLDALFEEKGS